MANKPDIWMPLYVAEYQSDTNRLTTIQHGAYMLLIMDYWRNGELPNNQNILLQITKLPDDAWSILEALLKHYFKLSSSNTWIHARIEKELAKAIKNQASASEKASKAAKKRWGNAPSIPQAMHKQCPSPSPSPSKEDIKDTPRKFSDDDLVIAEFIFSTVQIIDPKTKKPNLEKWADEIRLMRERDNRTHDEIRSVFIFASQDAFWKSNILSPSKLRDKFTTLLSQRARPSNGTNKQPGKISNAEHRRNIGEFIETQAKQAVRELGESLVPENAGDISPKMGCAVS